MGRGEPGIVPSLTTQRLYFRQESGIRQPGSPTPFSSGVVIFLHLPIPLA
jgi:hypothetical protein